MDYKLTIIALDTFNHSVDLLRRCGLLLVFECLFDKFLERFVVLLSMEVDLLVSLGLFVS